MIATSMMTSDAKDRVMTGLARIVIIISHRIIEEIDTGKRQGECSTRCSKTNAHGSPAISTR